MPPVHENVYGPWKVDAASGLNWRYAVTVSPLSAMFFVFSFSAFGSVVAMTPFVSSTSTLSS